MLTKTYCSVRKILLTLAIVLSISMAILNQPQVQASVTKEANFSVNVILNKPGMTYDLTSMEVYAEQGSVKIVEKEWIKIDETNAAKNDTLKDSDNIEVISKYYIYKSHSDPKLIVTLYEVNKTIYYPSKDIFNEEKIEGLGIKLDMPTKWNDKTVENEIKTLELDSKVNISKVNITEEIIEYIVQLGYNDKYIELSEIGDLNKTYKLMFIRDDISLFIYNVYKETGKDQKSQGGNGNLSISMEYPKESTTEEIDEDIRDILRFLSIDPDKWNEASRQVITEKEKDYYSAVDQDPGDFDWKAAIKKELEWLSSEAIIYGLTMDDILEISSESSTSETVFHENRSWVPLKDTKALPIKDEEMISLSNMIDWNEVPEHPPGKSNFAEIDAIHNHNPIVGLIVSLIIISLVISMYTRIRRKSILENINRKRIYEKIKKNPGIHFSALMKDLDIKSGTLSHHINLLENEELIKSRQSGMYRRFFLYGEKPLLTFSLSIIQEKILKLILDHPGISQAKISKEINSNKMKVNYHLKIMRDAKLLTLVKSGRESNCFITSTGKGFLQNTDLEASI